MRIPQTVTKAIATLDPALSAIPGEFDKVKSDLSSLGISYSPNPIQKAAGEAITARQTINSIILKGGYALTIHPWTMGAGEFGKGNYTEQCIGYLSPAQAASHLAGKITDPNDDSNTNVKCCMVFAIYADTQKSWIDKLKILCDIFPFGDLPMCQKRAEELLNIETSKMMMTKPFFNPHWAKFFNPFDSRIAEIKKDSDALLGFVEAFALDIDPVKELCDAIDARNTEITEANKAWGDLQSLIQTGSAEAFYFSGANPESISIQIQNFNTTSTAKYCALFAVMANNEDELKFFKEAFL